jgi:hypothetical protein
VLVIVALCFACCNVRATTVQDEIFGDSFDGFDVGGCDSGLPSASTDAAQYAAAIDLCQTTTEPGDTPGLISAALTQASGSATPAAMSRRIRTSFGSGLSPRLGSAMVALSTGVAVVQGESGYMAFQPGLDTGTFSAAPADWLTANGGAFPGVAGCPPALSALAYNSVMLTLRIRVPGNARSFSLSANFLGADFPEYVCSQFNDIFVVLLDSSYAGASANPQDKNLATYVAPGASRYPLGVNLARNDTGLFSQCVNGVTGCSSMNTGQITTCQSTSQLAGTGMDTADPGNCDANSLLGGGTGWLSIRGNVVPGETITLRLAIWDVGDGTYDSLVLLDNFRWSYNEVTPGVASDF